MNTLVHQIIYEKAICRSRVCTQKNILSLQDFLEHQENSEDMNVTFEKFSEEFKNDFVNLNLAWLRESFAVEPHDVAVLERCEVRCEFQGYFFEDDYHITIWSQ